jgi:hypothetical protein
VYSEVFQDILKRDDAAGLREGVSTADFTRRMLSVCFERPLALIRSEKQQTTAAAAAAAKQNRNASEILAQHGIPQPSVQPAEVTQEALLRKAVETNQKQLESLQNAYAQAREALKIAMEQIKATPPTTTKEVVQAARRQQGLSQQAVKNAEKVLAESKKDLASEVEKKKKQDEANKAPPPVAMTKESLELQHQGFRIIDTLVEHDAHYLTAPTNTDVIRTYRWLWHSKGRHLRLLHEELLPVKYQLESKYIASNLMAYSAARPSDADILFDLLRIFLEQTSVDFSHVEGFLEDMVSRVLSPEDKKKVLQRFFSILSSDRPEETKVLSIHYLVLPMLHSRLQQESKNGAVTTNTEVVDGEMLSRLVTESIAQGSRCGERLQIELLMMLTILIEHRSASPELAQHRKDLIKFGWGRLKSDDNYPSSSFSASSKLWAYVNVCTFISKFDETPSKLTLQVYFALLKSYQQEAKDLVRQALEILIPCLSKRLSAEDFDKCMKDTRKVMYEEGHGTPQLIHMLHIVVRHPVVFYGHRQLFVQLMANSLARLALAPNSQVENRALSLSICDLLFTWETWDETLVERHAQSVQAGEKRRVALSPLSSNTAPKKLKLPEGGSNNASSGKLTTLGGTISKGVVRTEIFSSTFARPFPFLLTNLPPFLLLFDSFLLRCRPTLQSTF